MAYFVYFMIIQMFVKYQIILTFILHFVFNLQNESQIKILPIEFKKSIDLEYFKKSSKLFCLLREKEYGRAYFLIDSLEDEYQSLFMDNVRNDYFSKFICEFKLAKLKNNQSLIIAIENGMELDKITKKLKDHDIFIEDLNNIFFKHHEIFLNQIDSPLINNVKNILTLKDDLRLQSNSESNTIYFIELKKLITEYGWPSAKQIGDLPLWGALLVTLEKNQMNELFVLLNNELQNGRLNPTIFALYTDWKQHSENGTQIYGTLKKESGEILGPDEIELKNLRKSLGLNEVSCN